MIRTARALKASGASPAPVAPLPAEVTEAVALAAEDSVPVVSVGGGSEAGGRTL